MKKPRIFMCVALLVIWQVVAVSHVHDSKRSAQQQSNTNTNSAVDEKQGAPKRKAGSFKTAQALLDKKGLPFDMEALTAPDWRENLAQTFAQMPEMQVVRRELDPLEGVVIADTLYLPEKVELAGETVILAKHLIFEGSNAVIRGNHNLYILPINTVHVIGTTLSNLNRSAKLAKTALPSWTDIQGLLENRHSADTSLTIDTSWYAAAPTAKARRVSQSSSFQIMDDRSGGPGGPGSNGAPGNGGSPGAPGGLGNSGLCGEQPNGGPGGLGKDGTDGDTGGPGGLGGPGGWGGDIYLSLSQGDTGTYTEISRGGPGGPGGPGGNGGWGGTGGNGGDGADCECNQGGQGSGGPGGPGGWGARGGPGGPGGPGGTGGNSGHIRVNYQCELLANVSTDSAAGSGGDPGYGGPVGYGGLAGQGGLGGNKGGGECPICPTGAVRGNDGDSGHSLGDGQVGSAGQRGADGISYAPEFVGFSVNCDPGRGCTDYWLCWDVYYCECYWLELSPTSGDITPQYWDCYCWYLYTYCEYLGCW